MKLNKIIDQVNKLVSNSSSFKLSYNKLEFYLNKSIDRINQFLGTHFRTPEEYYEDSKLYTSLKKDANPDYIINVDSKCNCNKYYYEDDIIHEPNGEAHTNDSNAVEYFYVVDKNIFVVYSEDNSIISVITEENRTLPNGTVITLYDIDKVLDIYDYNEIPDRYIRSCLIYATAAMYLEEEDELEKQYSIYLSKVDDELVAWRKECFSCFNIKDKDKDKGRNKNEYNPYSDYF